MFPEVRERYTYKTKFILSQLLSIKFDLKNKIKNYGTFLLKYISISQFILVFKIKTWKNIIRNFLLKVVS